VIPLDILSHQKFPDTWGHFPPYVGLKRLCILVMLKLCSGTGWLLSRTAKRNAFGS